MAHGAAVAPPPTAPTDTHVSIPSPSTSKPMSRSTSRLPPTPTSSSYRAPVRTGRSSNVTTTAVLPATTLASPGHSHPAPTRSRPPPTVSGEQATSPSRCRSTAVALSPPTPQLPRPLRRLRLRPLHRRRQLPNLRTRPRPRLRRRSLPHHSPARTTAWPASAYLTEPSPAMAHGAAVAPPPIGQDATHASIPSPSVSRPASRSTSRLPPTPTSSCSKTPARTARSSNVTTTAGLPATTHASPEHCPRVLTRSRPLPIPLAAPAISR